MNTNKYPKFEHFDPQLAEFRKVLGDEAYNSWVNGFKMFYANPECFVFSQWYISYESLSSKFKAVFGVTNTFFWKVFYYYLADGGEKEQISLYHFVKNMSPFLSEEPGPVMRCVFRLYDINHDGIISIVDLLQAQASVSWDSQYGQEIHSVVNKYVNEVLLGKQRRRVIYNIEKHNFEMFLNKSCLVSELLHKVLKCPYEGWPEIKTRKDSSDPNHRSIFSRLHELSKEEYAEKMVKYRNMYKNLEPDTSDYNKLRLFKVKNEESKIS